MEDQILYQGLYLMAGFLGGVMIMLKQNPYMYANFKSRVLRRSYGVAEVETNNMEILTKIIEMEVPEVVIGRLPDSPTFRVVRSYFRRKYLCPTIHFNYLDPDPVSFIHEKKEIMQVPARVQLTFPDTVFKQEGKNLMQEEINRTIEVDFSELKIVPVKETRTDEKGNNLEIDTTWITVNEVPKIKSAEILPEKLSSLVNKIRARSEIEASLQRLAQLVAMVNNTKWTLIGMAVILILSIATVYFVYQIDNSVRMNTELTKNLTSSLISAKPIILENLNITGAG
jgi:hypothetical protein